MLELSFKELDRILLEKGLIAKQDLDRAHGLVGKTGMSLFEVMVEEGMVDEAEMVRCVGEQLDLRFVSLQGFESKPELVGLLPRDVIEKLIVLPIGRKEIGGKQVLYLAMSDPWNGSAVSQVEELTGMRVREVLVGPRDMKEALSRLYGRDEYLVLYPDEDEVLPDESEEGILPADELLDVLSPRRRIETRPIFKLRAGGKEGRTGEKPPSPVEHPEAVSPEMEARKPTPESPPVSEAKEDPERSSDHAPADPLPGRGVFMAMAQSVRQDAIYIPPDCIWEFIPERKPLYSVRWIEEPRAPSILPTPQVIGETPAPARSLLDGFLAGEELAAGGEVAILRSVLICLLEGGILGKEELGTRVEAQLGRLGEGLPGAGEE